MSLRLDFGKLISNLSLFLPLTIFHSLDPSFSHITLVYGYGALINESQFEIKDYLFKFTQDGMERGEIIIIMVQPIVAFIKAALLDCSGRV